MDNKLTPGKIQRLLHLAESSTPGAGPGAGRARRRVLADRNEEPPALDCDRATLGSSHDSNTRCESSGILDLERCEGFGESCLSGMIDKFNVNMSFSKSTTFNPGEMTGRSTGTADLTDNPTNRSTALNEGVMLSTSASVDELAARMQQQSCDVADIVRNSIANFSFQTHRDLTQDEMSFIKERGDLPVPPSQLNLNLTTTMDKKWTECSLKADTTSDISVGSYFRKGSVDLVKMIGRSDSPSYEVSMGPSLLEGDSRNYGVQPGFTTINDSAASDYALDSTLDRVPTKQPRAPPPAVFCAPQLQHLAQPLTSTKTGEDSSLGDASLSISLIAKYLGSCESEVTPSILITKAKRNQGKKTENQPYLPDKDTNVTQKDTFTIPYKNANKSRLVPTDLANPNFVSTLKQTGRSDTASSTGSVNTVIHTPIFNQRILATGQSNKENISLAASGVPNKVINCNKIDATKEFQHKVDSTMSDCGKVSKTKLSVGKSSPSVCTVQENRISTSIGSEESPLQNSRREAMLPHFISPNCQYRELDKSVNWQELLLQKEVVVKGQWVDVAIEPKEAYVGVCTAVTVRLTSLSDAWLSAHLKLDDSMPGDSSVAVDVPRFPVLLSPGATETVNLTVTAFKQLDELLKFNIVLKDTCEDIEMQQEATLNINFKLPALKIITSENTDDIRFAPMQESSETVKSFIITSDCQESLQLALSVSEGSPIFSISNVEVIKIENIERRLAIDHRLVTEEGMVAGCKYRAMRANSKLTCVLPKGNAVRVMMMCRAPKLADIEAGSSKATLTGSLSVHLLGTNVLVQSVAVTGTVGTVKLLFRTEGDKLHLHSDKIILPVANAGSIPGTWRVLVKKQLLGEPNQHFQVFPERAEIQPGAVTNLSISYVGPEDELNHGLLVLENIHESKDAVLELIGGQEKFTSFPIKTTQSELAWLREGRKEINLKNTSDRKVTIKCKLYGEGYRVETMRESGTELMFTFAPNECRGLSVVYEPVQKGIHKAKLALYLENDPGSVKSVRLHGCSGAGVPGACVGWVGSVLTCGGVALVLAARRAPVTLTLHNRSHEPTFFSAKLQFNMQYRALGAWSRVSPARGIIAPLGNTRLTVELDWTRLERLLSDTVATTLASLSVLVGAEITRRRILRILSKEQKDATPGSPSEDLSRLKGTFQGEDHSLDVVLQDFEETKKSLEVLTRGVQELTAQIELARDVTDDRTILVADETGIEHHTLLD